MYQHMKGHKTPANQPVPLSDLPRHNLMRLWDWCGIPSVDFWAECCAVITCRESKHCSNLRVFFPKRTRG